VYGTKLNGFNNVEQVTELKSPLVGEKIVWYKYCLLKPEEYKQIEQSLAKHRND